MRHYTNDTDADQGKKRFLPLGKRSKAPIHKDWPNKLYSLKEIEQYIELGHNVGIIPSKHDLFVIDSDSGALTEKMISLFGLPHCARTPERGHWYFKKSGDWSSIKKNKYKYPGCEVFTGPGFQVVCPGSIHPTGVMYKACGENSTNPFVQFKVFNDMIDSCEPITVEQFQTILKWIAHATQAPVKPAHAHASPAHAHASPAHAHASPAHAHASPAYRYAEKAFVPSGIGNRNANMFKVATILRRDFSMSEEQSLSMLNDFNHRNIVPLSEQETAKINKNAHRYAKGTYGSKLNYHPEPNQSSKKKKSPHKDWTHKTDSYTKKKEYEKFSNLTVIVKEEEGKKVKYITRLCSCGTVSSVKSGSCVADDCAQTRKALNIMLRNACELPICPTCNPKRIKAKQRQYMKWPTSTVVEFSFDIKEYDLCFYKSFMPFVDLMDKEFNKEGLYTGKKKERILMFGDRTMMVILKKLPDDKTNSLDRAIEKIKANEKVFRVKRSEMTGPEIAKEAERYLSKPHELTVEIEKANRKDALEFRYLSEGSVNRTVIIPTAMRDLGYKYSDRAVREYIRERIKEEKKKPVCDCCGSELQPVDFDDLVEIPDEFYEKYNHLYPPGFLDSKRALIESRRRSQET